MIDGRLDVVEERRAVGAQEEQRDQPPQGAEGRERPATTASARVGAGRGVRVSRNTTPSGSTAKVAAALTPPTIATASAESAAARRGEPVTEPRTSGSSTHGASALGQASMEIGPRVLSIRGRERVGEAGEDARHVGPDAERTADTGAADERRAQHQAPARAAAPPSRAGRRRGRAGRTAPSATGSRRPGSAPARTPRRRPRGAGRGRGSGRGRGRGRTSCPAPGTPGPARARARPAARTPQPGGHR